MVDDATFAMLCREHDKATGGDQVFPSQRYHDPHTRVVWTVGAIVSSGGERTALCTSRRSGVLHVPASTLATTYERLPDAH